jgi:hypothetical protein
MKLLQKIEAIERGVWLTSALEGQDNGMSYTNPESLWDDLSNNYLNWKKNWDSSTFQDNQSTNYSSAISNKCINNVSVETMEEY